MSYVIIDIPKSLYFSLAFLRLNFPNERFCYAADPSCLSGPLADFDFMFVPTIHAESLAGSDFTLFCNTASLGEMKNCVIRYWMDLVQNRLQVEYFFGLNRFLNTMHPKGHLEHENFRLDENCCSVSFDQAWRILQWELEPPLRSLCSPFGISYARSLRPRSDTLSGTCIMALKMTSVFVFK